MELKNLEKPGKGDKEMIARHFSIENQSAEYACDFVDDWKHRIRLENILPRGEGTKFRCASNGSEPALRRIVVGCWGYDKLLEALQDPDSAEDKELLGWIGEGFDPEYFDAKAIYFMNSDR